MDDDNSNLLVAQLLYLDSMNHKDITMYINSPGGSVTAGTYHTHLAQLPPLPCCTALLLECCYLLSVDLPCTSLQSNSCRCALS